MPVVDLADSPDVVAIMPTMGEKPARTTAALDAALASATSQRLAIVCVLNSSTPVAGLERPGVTVVQAGLNLGWAGGLVFGAALGESPLLWFLQDDLLVEPDTLDALVAALDESLGLVTPLVVDEGGMVPVASCGGVIAADGTLASWLPAEPTAPASLPDLASLSYVPSRGMLVRRAAFDAAGGPDPRLYPVQFVDVDFCHRVRAAGFGTALTVDARVRHAGSAATPSGFAQFLHSRNAERFIRRWFPKSKEKGREFFPVHGFRPDSGPSAMLHPSISAELLAAVAQSGTDALTHLAQVFSAQHRELESSGNELHLARLAVNELRDAVARLEEDRAVLHDGLAAASVTVSEAVVARRKSLAALESAQAEVAELRRRIAALESSRSWRVTRPLRALRRRP